MRLDVSLGKSSTLFFVRLVMRLLTVLGTVRDAMAFVALLQRLWGCAALCAGR
jgi:hypothetical protein